MLPALLVGCSPKAALVPLGAEEVGLLPRSEAIVGRDGGGSSLAFGRSVWAFGDTVLAFEDEDRGTNWHTNSYDHADPSIWRDGFDAPADAVGAPRLFVELTEEEWAADPRWALWPSQPLVGAEGARAWVLYGLYRDGGPSGIGVASWAGLDQPVVRHEVDGSWLLFPEPEVEWANAPVVDGPFLYTFGCPLDGFDRPCSLARVPFGEVDLRRSWRFWDGREWSADDRAAEPLFQGAPIMECSYNRALGRWWVVYSAPFSHEVVARTASELTGPWSDEVVLLEVPDGDAPYDAVHHPDLEEDDGATQWITYSQPNGDGWFGSDHHLWRVELGPR